MPLVRLKDRREVATGTMAFYFLKPQGFTYQAGQFVELTLLDPAETDAEGNSRAFTLASAPYEDDLMIATRMRDTAFKRVLKTLPLGSEVQLDGPFGNLTLAQDAARPAAFLAGGIGITPFRSMALQAAREKLSRPLYLFYSNRRPEDAAFLEELRRVAEENRNFTLVATMTQMEDSRQLWTGKTGYLDKEMLRASLGSLPGLDYFIAGPPGLVKGMRKMLEEAGVEPKSIHAEEFDGY